MLDKEFLLIAAVLAIGLGVIVPKLEGPQDRQIAVAQADLPRFAARPPLSPRATPVQTDIAPFEVNLGNGFHGTVTHRYTLAGQVLLRRPYEWDATAQISPVDLAIGWGDMAAPDVLERFMFAGGKRLVHIRATEAATDLNAVMAHWSNTHIIPTTDSVRDAALALQPGQKVRLHGYLIKVSGPGGLTWDGSTSRDDRGYSACEIMLVERVEVLEDSKAATDAEA